jgi:hypothetical protein
VVQVPAFDHAVALDTAPVAALRVAYIA